MSTKHKNSIVDTLKTDSLSILQNPQVKGRLGSYAIALEDILDRTVSVGVGKDGFIDAPSPESDIIPVVLLHIGETAYIGAVDSAMSSRQIDAIKGEIGDEKGVLAARKFKEHLVANKKHKQLPVFDDAESLAAVGSNFWVPDDVHLVKGRPFVSMNSNALIEGRLSPIVFLHELIHVMQNEKRPVTVGDMFHRYRIRSELEAYHVAAQIMYGFKDTNIQGELLKHSSKAELDKARKIEEVRAATQTDSDPFAASNSVIKGLVDNELGITTELGSLIRDIKKQQ